MAKKRISELPAGSALNGTELVAIVQSGTTKRTTAQDIANLGNASGVEGSGTIDYIAKFTASSTIGDSIISDNGTMVTIDGDFRVALADANVNLQGSTKSYLLQVIDGNNRFRIYDNTANEERFTISSTGEASFSNSVTANSFIKSGGTSAQYLKADGSVSTLTNPITGTGTTNYLPKFTGTSALGNSVIYDDGTNIALGTTTALTGGGAAKWITLNGSTYGGGIISSVGSVAKGYLYYDNASETFALQAASSVGATIWTNSTERMRITSAGNVGIGSTNPAYTLDVNGTARVSGVAGNGSSFFNFNPTSANSGFNWVSQAFASNLIANNNLIHFIGQSGSSKNAAYFGFKYSADGSNDNILTLGLYAVDNVLNINGAGNVGIGTTSPNQKLVINQGATGFNQGIPATSGTTQNGMLRLRPSVASYGETLDFGMNVADTYGWIQSTNADNLSVNYALSLNPNGGSVLVGTKVDAGYKLDVNGIARATSLFVPQTISTTSNAESSGSLRFNYATNANSRTWRLANDIDAYGDFAIQQSTTQTGSTFANKLIFSPSGAATFSSSVSMNTFGKITSITPYLELRDTNWGASTFVQTGVNVGATAAGDYFNIYNQGDKGLSYVRNGNVDFMISPAGNIGINTTTPDASAKVQIDSTTQGFLVPRMLESEINAISSPATGLLVYNTDQDHMCMYDGSVWKKLSMSNM